jgi:RimJ/RimL family protein N-acetyltransferase
MPFTAGSPVSYAPARSPRLRRERPWLEHLALYRDLFSDPAVALVLWPGALGGVRSDDQVTEILRADIRHWQELGCGPWVFFERANGVFVGRGGLRRARIAGEDRVEVLYALRPDAWGRGYATEIALLAVGECRRVGLPEVHGLVAPGNHASRRVLEKAGIRFEATVEHGGLPHLLGRLRTMH